MSWQVQAQTDKLISVLVSAYPMWNLKGDKIDC